VDSRVHPRLIGQGGKGVRRLMQDYNVEITFPRSTDPNPNLIVITGNNEDDVLDVKEEILSQADRLVCIIEIKTSLL